MQCTVQFLKYTRSVHLTKNVAICLFNCYIRKRDRYSPYFKYTGSEVQAMPQYSVCISCRLQLRTKKNKKRVTYHTCQNNYSRSLRFSNTQNNSAILCNLRLQSLHRCCRFDSQLSLTSYLHTMHTTTYSVKVKFAKTLIAVKIPAAVLRHL